MMIIIKNTKILLQTNCINNEKDCYLRNNKTIEMTVKKYDTLEGRVVH
jgi:hypothetical protein